MRPPLLFIGSSFVHKTSNILCTLRYIIVFYCHECLGCICVVFLCYVDLFSPCGKIFLFLAPLPSCKVIRFANNDIAEIFPKYFLIISQQCFFPVVSVVTLSASSVQTHRKRRLITSSSILAFSVV